MKRQKNRKEVILMGEEKLKEVVKRLFSIYAIVYSIVLIVFFIALIVTKLTSNEFLIPFVFKIILLYLMKHIIL